MARATAVSHMDRVRKYCHKAVSSQPGIGPTRRVGSPRLPVTPCFLPIAPTPRCKPPLTEGHQCASEAVPRLAHLSLPEQSNGIVGLLLTSDDALAMHEHTAGFRVLAAGCRSSRHPLLFENCSGAIVLKNMGLQ